MDAYEQYSTLERASPADDVICSVQPAPVNFFFFFWSVRQVQLKSTLYFLLSLIDKTTYLPLSLLPIFAPVTRSHGELSSWWGFEVSRRRTEYTAKLATDNGFKRPPRKRLTQTCPTFRWGWKLACYRPNREAVMWSGIDPEWWFLTSWRYVFIFVVGPDYYPTIRTKSLQTSCWPFIIIIIGFMNEKDYNGYD